MKKILTAIGNSKLNEYLNKQNNICVMARDIIYIEGIIEFLEQNKKIDYIIINIEILKREIINDILYKIFYINDNIKIIIIADKDINIERNNNIIIIDELNNEIIKNIINNGNTKIKNINTEENKKEEEIQYIQNKTISILGSGGTGKSIFTILLAKINKGILKNVLILDFNFINSSIHSILGLKKYPIKKEKKCYEMKDLIIKVQDNIELLSGLDLLYDEKMLINENKLLEILNILKKEYELIIIDTSSECFYKYNKKIVENTDKSIFLIEPNISEIHKSINLLKIYIENWKIEKNKISILFNKYNNYSIDYAILKNIFSEFNILGKIDLNDKYTEMINKNKIELNKKIKNEYLKINNKIMTIKSKGDKIIWK